MPLVLGVLGRRAGMITMIVARHGWLNTLRCAGRGTSFKEGVYGHRSFRVSPLIHHLSSPQTRRREKDADCNCEASNGSLHLVPIVLGWNASSVAVSVAPFAMVMQVRMRFWISSVVVDNFKAGW